MVSESSNSETDERARLAVQLRHAVLAASSLRQQAATGTQAAAARARLRSWQAGRLAATHADSLADPRLAPAARFFLSDLYGPKDFSARDAEMERILPALARLLPLPGLRTVVLAVELDAISEELDAAMVDALARAAKESIDAESYAAAYRRVGQPEKRARQIDLAAQIGEALDRLPKNALAHVTIRLLRKPAKAAGLSALHEFLERGIDAFRHMGDASEFLDRVTHRERSIMQQLFAGSKDPFALT